MKTVNLLTRLLLVAAIGWIIYMYMGRSKAAAPKALAAPANGTAFNVLLHVNNPLSAMERLYNLLPGTTFSQLIIGGPAHTPGVTLAGLPFISGTQAFPRQAILQLQALKKKRGQDSAIHFAMFQTPGFPSFGFADIKYTHENFNCYQKPSDTLPNQKLPAQVISWMVPAKTDTSFVSRALMNGYKICGNRLTGRGVYLTDPSGFLVFVDFSNQ